MMIELRYVKSSKRTKIMAAIGHEGYMVEYIYKLQYRTSLDLDIGNFTGDTNVYKWSDWKDVPVVEEE